MVQSILVVGVYSELIHDDHGRCQAACSSGALIQCVGEALQAPDCRRRRQTAIGAACQRYDLELVFLCQFQRQRCRRGFQGQQAARLLPDQLLLELVKFAEAAVSVVLVVNRRDCRVAHIGLELAGELVIGDVTRWPLSQSFQRLLAPTVELGDQLARIVAVLRCMHGIDFSEPGGDDIAYALQQARGKPDMPVVQVSPKRGQQFELARGLWKGIGDTREAGFEMLMHVSELQKIVFLAHYDKDPVEGNPRKGWTEVLTLKDLAVLMPPAEQLRVAELEDAWAKNWTKLGNDDAGAEAIDTRIDDLRSDILNALQSLE